MSALTAPETFANGLVTLQKSGGVALITLCNAPANGYSYDMMRDFDEAILTCRFDDDIHVIAVAGEGEKFFCAGADISMLNGVTPRFKYNFCLHANETMLRLEHTSKLVIAAIDGHCVGGGFEIALACDLRVARRGSGKCGLPEVNLGVLPGTGGTQRLGRLLPKDKAIELMASARLMSFDHALDMGLVTKLIDAESSADFMTQFLAYAATFCPPVRASKAVGHIKRAIQSGTDLPLEAGLTLERELQQRLFESDDASEGIRAFVERRKPEFTGR